MSKPTNKTLSPYQQMIQSGIDGYMEEKSGQKPANPKDGSTTPPSSNTGRKTTGSPDDCAPAGDNPLQDNDGDVVMEDEDQTAKNLQDDNNNEHGPQSQINKLQNPETSAQRIERMWLKAKAKAEARRKEDEAKKNAKLSKKQKRVQNKKNKKKDKRTEAEEALAEAEKKAEQEETKEKESLKNDTPDPDPEVEVIDEEEANESSSESDDDKNDDDNNPYSALAQKKEEEEERP